MRRLDEEIIEKIKQLREDGYKIKDVCKTLNVNKNTVVKYSKYKKKCH